MKTEVRNREYSFYIRAHLYTHTTDQIGKEFRIPLCFLCGDYQKAAEWIEQNATLKALLQHGISHSICQK